jgi:hypothetical protein
MDWNCDNFPVGTILLDSIIRGFLGLHYLKIKDFSRSVYGFHSSAGPLIQPLIPIPFFFSFGSVVAVLE